ncbi:hypothetical protein N9Y92_00720 [Chlamydiales bacterium]|nr:hypothetical protein [Chlamydiales bacterium]
MFNRIIITICFLAFFVIIALNVIPLVWDANPPTFIRHDMIRDMAIKHNDILFTLNFDQSKRITDIFNRAITVHKVQPTTEDAPLDFEEIVIYRFNNPAIVITPIAWVDKNLVFKAPEWSDGYLMETSKDELYEILSNSYDKEPYKL